MIYSTIDYSCGLMKLGGEIGSKANVHFASRAWETAHSLRYIPVALPVLCLKPFLTVDVSKGISSIHDLEYAYSGGCAYWGQKARIGV
jgi:hypothetical protein